MHKIFKTAIQTIGSCKNYVRSKKSQTLIFKQTIQNEINTRQRLDEIVSDIVLCDEITIQHATQSCEQSHSFSVMQKLKNVVKQRVPKNSNIRCSSENKSRGWIEIH